MLEEPTVSSFRVH